MTSRPKNINYFLVDGTPTGRIRCTITNWTGVAYGIPRKQLNDCKERAELSQSGVYFLIGASDGENAVYIGQAGIRKNGNGVINRLQEHKKDSEKNYWQEADVFTTSNDSFGQTEISYLENRFTKMVREAGRYLVKNDNEPTHGNITEEKERKLEEFVDYAKIVMGVLGHKMFEPLLQPDDTIAPTAGRTPSASIPFFIKQSDADVEIRQTNEGFVMLKGGRIKKRTNNSCPYNIKIERDNKDNVDAAGIVQKDILFTSPSAAAAFVLGSSVNGTAVLRTDEGKTFKEIGA
ncbi:MAG: GIY-YIG nuclease family protein [Opitutaceae bacterium]|jgi:hypothetical protein|nr:GIY-YIG nuclease family protein [Opitutaceae bacterium]